MKGARTDAFKVKRRNFILEIDEVIIIFTGLSWFNLKDMAKILRLTIDTLYHFLLNEVELYE